MGEILIMYRVGITDFSTDGEAAKKGQIKNTETFPGWCGVIDPARPIIAPKTLATAGGPATVVCASTVQSSMAIGPCLYSSTMETLTSKTLALPPVIAASEISTQAATLIARPETIALR